MGYYLRLSTNHICPRLVKVVEQAARVAQRQERVSAAPAPGISAEDAAKAVPALRVPEGE